MPQTATIEAHIAPEVKERATAILAELGLTLPDAVTLFLTRTADEGTLPFPREPEPEGYRAWVQTKIQEALDDPRPLIPHEEVKARFAKRRAKLLAESHQ